MSIFSRGYDQSRTRLNKNPSFLKSCFNCDFYYQARGDLSELCQNVNVLRYDMVTEGGRVYCLHWVPSVGEREKHRKNTGVVYSMRYEQKGGN